MNEAQASPEAAAAAIQIRGLVQTFGGRERVLDGVDLSIPEHKTSYLLGPSGTGKSVLLKHIVALLRPERGEIRVFGEPLPYSDRKKLSQVRQRFGVLFQGGALFDNLSVYDNIAFPLRAHRRDLSAEQTRSLIVAVLESVGLDSASTLGKPISQLSGGMLKRVALARAVVLKPEIILYDEPTTGLDPVNRLTVDEMIADAEKKLGLTNFVISHDIESALALADHVAFLNEGHIVYQGPPEGMVKCKDEVIQRFLSADRKVREGL